MKSVWNGSIAFGLVNIPVRLYSAIESQAISFRLLDRKSRTPIQYKRWCPECTEEVAWEDVVKALEIDKGEYLILEKEELAKIRPEKTETIEIIEFTDSAKLNPIYFNKHYYVAPERKREKAYFLFKEVLMLSAKVAIGSFVMREKEHVCAIESYRSGLLLTTLNYDYEIRDIERVEELKEKPGLTKEETDLASRMIEKLYNPDFDMAAYKDSYAEELKKLVKKKSMGESIVLEKKGRPAKKEKDLVKALKASLK